MNVHAIQTGRLVGNRAFLAGRGWRHVLRPRDDFEFPVFVYLLEHPEGLIAIDTGMNARVWPTPGPVGRFIPRGQVEPGEEIGPQMRAHGLRPEDVETVILTHLDPDHIGGISHFRQAEFLVHRREHEFATSFAGRLRQRPGEWPEWFTPTLVDLDGGRCGAFAHSRAVTEHGDVRLIPLPGHTVGQIGVIVQTDGATLLFAADHTLDLDWFRQRRLSNLGIAAPAQYERTDERVRRFVAETDAVLIPAHDAGAPARLAERVTRTARQANR